MSKEPSHLVVVPQLWAGETDQEKIKSYEAFSERYKNLSLAEQVLCDCVAEVILRGSKDSAANRSNDRVLP